MFEDGGGLFLDVVMLYRDHEYFTTDINIQMFRERGSGGNEVVWNFEV